MRVPALHREAVSDTTGNYWPSAFRTYVEWAIRARERRTPVTVEEFRVTVIKDRLTLWFYCVKEAARRHGIGGEPH